MSEPTDEYRPPTELSRLLDVPLRTLERWAREGRIRTRPSPMRKRAKLYHAGDAERLAAASVRQRDAPAEAPTPSTEIIPQGDLLRMVAHKDAQLAEANEKLHRATIEFGHLQKEIGRLQGQLEAHQKLLESAQDSDERRRAAEAERDQLRQALERLPRWIRLLFLRRR